MIAATVDLSASYSIFPLGDSAITIDLGNCIDEQLNRRALVIHDWLQAHRMPGIQDILVAYSSVSIYYDPTAVRAGGLDGFPGAYYRLEQLIETALAETAGKSLAETAGTPDAIAEAPGQGHHFRIPVCYEKAYAPDLDWVAGEKGLSPDEVIGLHSSGLYRVYMVGFLPGFPYLGKTDVRLEVARKPQPTPVKAGGVGIAGMQTGIYPLNSPGGWRIIGQTPTALFNPNADPPIHLQTGDSVQFYPISESEFRDWK
jgi:inhibitor of KinA